MPADRRAFRAELARTRSGISPSSEDLVRNFSGLSQSSGDKVKGKGTGKGKDKSKQGKGNGKSKAKEAKSVSAKAESGETRSGSLTTRDRQGVVAFLLSPAASTEKSGAAADATSIGRTDIKQLNESQMREALDKHVPNVAFMLDRTGQRVVSDFIWMSYQNGLPIYQGNPAVQQHTIHALRFIFHAAEEGNPAGGFALRRLAEAYQSCQAEQGRTIDTLFGKISGRDATLQDQVLALVDSFKALCLEAVVHKLNPDAARMSDAYPSRQAPHITSAYLVAVGDELGLRGTKAAASDYNQPQGVQRSRILEAFREQFCLDHLAEAVAADVNQQATGAERIIDRDLLAKWAAATSEASRGEFNAHSIYFDESRSREYAGQPEEGNEYQPFLRRDVALQILAYLFLPEKVSGKRAETDASATLEARLTAFLLSSAASTEKSGATADAQGVANIKELNETEVRETLEKFVPNVAFMLDRTGEVPVSNYIWMSYQHGIPIYRENRAVQQHTIHALRFLFQAAITGKPPGGADALKRLAEAYQSCQAEQGRMIDTLYGKISGRDAALQDQVLALVDSFKALCLEAVVHKLNPDAAGMSDAYPHRQAPHIYSAYLLAVGEELGLRGTRAAMSDYNRPQHVNRQQVLEAFKEQWSIRDLAAALVADVNQQAEDAERVIGRDMLAKWAAATAEKSDRSFNAHSIYYDEDRAEEYEGKPEEGNEYQPFLRCDVAVGVLINLFVPSTG